MKIKIKALIKKIIPNGLITWIKMNSDPKYSIKIYNNIKNINKNTAVIIGSPIHTNLGDHLITLSEIEFLKDAGFKEIIEIPTEMYQVYRKRLIKYIPQDTTIYINGGGWMGNVWIPEEKIIQDILRSFCNNHIIIFPQTIYYDKTIQPYDELIIESRKSMDVCSDLSLFVRDMQSYKFACENFKSTKTYLVPDIALYYFNQAKSCITSNRKNDIGVCLRSDRELFRDKKIENSIIDELINKGFNMTQIDTMSEKRVSVSERNNYVRTRLTEFSKKKLIITDRLHGMIFSYITQTPCIVFDNKTRKVSGVYNEWLKNCKYIFPIFENYNENDLNHFIDCINNEKIKFDYILDDKFDVLREAINNG